MSFFDETQLSKPPEATRHHELIKILILLPLRADLFYIFYHETPCNSQGGIALLPLLVLIGCSVVVV